MTIGQSIKLLIVILTGFSAICGGCATSPKATESWPEYKGPDAILHESDTISIRFPYTPELDEEQVIRPDGMIAMPFIGEIQAEGKTPSELREELTSLYDTILRNPEVTVIVRSYGSRQVYVGGEVRTPGAIPITKEMTVPEAILLAGGELKSSARMGNVVVVRRQDETYHVRVFNLKKSRKLAETSPFFLQANDLVIVPRTIIDRIDQWTEQYLNRIIPDNAVLSFDYNLNDENYNNETGTGITIGAF